MPADLFIYALVAAGLVFWLRSILGTRHGEERSRPEAFVTTEKESEDGLGEILGEIKSIITQDDEIRDLAQNPVKNYAIANKTAENGLIDIAAKSEFDIHFFMEGAQDAFVMIVEAFADGEREELRGLLADDVYNAFETAITEREEKKHKQITDIHAIRKVEVVEARLDGKKAFVTVRFVAEESSVTRDEKDEIIAGHPEKTSEMQDIWTFGRDIKSKSPAWLVIETRGGFEDDNDLIPDSH